MSAEPVIDAERTAGYYDALIEDDPSRALRDRAVRISVARRRRTGVEGQPDLPRLDRSRARARRQGDPLPGAAPGRRPDLLRDPLRTVVGPVGPGPRGRRGDPHRRWQAPPGPAERGGLVPATDGRPVVTPRRGLRRSGAALVRARAARRSPHRPKPRLHGHRPWPRRCNARCCRPHSPSSPGFEIGSAFRPAGDGSVIGGDFYDVYSAGDGRWGIVARRRLRQGRRGRHRHGTRPVHRPGGVDRRRSTQRCPPGPPRRARTQATPPVSAPRSSSWSTRQATSPARRCPRRATTCRSSCTPTEAPRRSAPRVPGWECSVRPASTMSR